MRSMNIAVIGDTMWDIDIHCQIVKRYGSAPVLRELSRVERPGGAGNVAAMCRALGAEVLLIGADQAKREPTIKRRLLVNGQLIARHDSETTERCVWGVHQRAALDFFRPDGIIVCDHGKGFVTDLLMKELPGHVPIFVDSVATTPAEVTATWIGSPAELPRDVQGNRIVKLGAYGLMFRGKWYRSACSQQDCVDDVGAGDQLIASLVIARLLGRKWETALLVAVGDAGEQCRRPGIVPVTRSDSFLSLLRSETLTETMCHDAVVVSEAI